MPYKMIFYVDGGCRNNGYTNAIGAAAAVQMLRSGKHKAWSQEIENPTNQRAEISAIIIALEEALAAHDNCKNNPGLDVTIYSDSDYAVKCMNQWRWKWESNGWRNAAGKQVANRDLIQKAAELDGDVWALGKVRYKYIPREQNGLADGYCNDCMDDMQADW